VISSQDLLIVLVLGLFLFGAKRLPELAGAVGKAMREFRKSATTEADPPPVPSAPARPETCTSCQAELAPDWTHCPRCGTPVRSGAPPGDRRAPPATG
jgi:TatA/E family protein of Tat protein translocase